MLFVFALLLITIFLFITDKVRLDVVATGVILTLMLVWDIPCYAAFPCATQNELTGKLAA